MAPPWLMSMCEETRTAPGFLGCSRTTARPDSRKFTKHTVGRLVTYGNGWGGTLVREEAQCSGQYLCWSDTIGTCTEHHVWCCGEGGGGGGSW